MNEAAKAMATWLGALARPGFTLGGQEKAGLSVAEYVLGSGRLTQLRTWFAFQPPDVQIREQEGAIEAIIHMAHADSDFDENERAFLEQIIAGTGLPGARKDALRQRLDSKGELGDLSQRVTNDVLREMLLALCWELAMADERIAPEEMTAYDEIARRLGVPGDRATELRESLSAEV